MVLGVVGCGDDDGGGPPPDGGVSDGAADDAARDGSQTGDAAADGSDEDAEVVADGGVDAAMTDAGTDAEVMNGEVHYGKGSATGPDSELGRSLAIDEDTLVIGSPGEAGGGAAYVFVRTESGWVEQAHLLAEHRDPDDRFGGSVGIDGDTIVVGAVGEGSSATGVGGDATLNALGNAGAAYVFTRSGDTWTQTAYLKASNTGAGDNFGYAVAISGATIAVSAHTEASSATGVDGDQANNGASFSGAVYVFAQSGNTWAQQAYVKASNTGQFDRFGVALDIDGDTLAVGAYYEDGLSSGVNGDQMNNMAPESGAVYVFTRAVSTWSQQAYVKANNCGSADWFGGSVSLEGDRLVVGARYEDGIAGDPLSEGGTDSGAAYVFARDAGAWSQVAYVKPTISDADDAFGIMVALKGDVIAVGAMEEDSVGVFPDADPLDNSQSNAGAAYLFNITDDVVTQTHYLKATNTDEDDAFGSALCLSDTRVVVGAFAERGQGNIATNEGAFYVYNY